MSWLSDAINWGRNQVNTVVHWVDNAANWGRTQVNTAVHWVNDTANWVQNQVNTAVTFVDDTVHSAWKWASDNVSSMPLDYFTIMATNNSSASMGHARYFIPGNADRDVNAVMSGSKWGGTTITYSTPDSRSDYEWINPSASGYKRLSYESEQAFHYILKGYSPNGGSGMRLSSVEGFTNLTAIYAGRDEADVKLSAFTPGSIINRSHAYYPGVPVYGGDLWVTNGDKVPVVGTYQYYLLLHELGHALGLKHTHDSGAKLPKMSAAHDNTEYSVMSYNTPDSPQTYMMYDIAALQDMYGADFTTNAGNTVYTWNSATGETSVNGAGQGRPGVNKIFLTIWDGGGVDTYDLSNYRDKAVVDLNPGGYSLFSTAQQGTGVKGNVYNALQYKGDDRSLIENATTGSGDDTITGNKANNVLTGNAGNDSISGQDGNDTLYGGTGNDKLGGGWGHDVLKGDEGSDLLNGENGNDNIAGGAGQDTLWGGWGADRLSGDDGNDFLGGEGDNDTIYGGGGYDSLWGGTGHDMLSGDDGNDFLAGEAGADTLFGGAGNDTAYGGEGDDTVRGDDGNDFLAGENGNDALNGGTGQDSLFGGGGNDVLDGSAGNDILDGETGNDQLWGGMGADRFRFSFELNSATNVDRIMDFKASEDKIELGGRVFARLSTNYDHTLTSSNFKVGTGATTLNEHIIYNSATGELFYDADGSGAGAQVKFAELSKGLVLTASTFILI